MSPKISYRIYKSPPLEPILSQMSSVHIIMTYYFKIRFIIILPSTPRSLKWLFQRNYNDITIRDAASFRPSKDVDIMNTGMAISNPARTQIYLLVFLCCAALYRWKPCRVLPNIYGICRFEINFESIQGRCSYPRKQM